MVPKSGKLILHENEWKNLNMYEETVKLVNYLNKRKLSYRNFDTGNIFHNSVKSLHLWGYYHLLFNLFYSSSLFHMQF